VHPLAVPALHEFGIDISSQRSKNVNEFLGERFDYIITLCAEEVCPLFPGNAQRLHWTLPDPAAVEGSDHERLAAFRRTVADLQARVDEFIGRNDQAFAR
jgi:arsenate reductase